MSKKQKMTSKVRKKKSSTAQWDISKFYPYIIAIFSFLIFIQTVEFGFTTMDDTDMIVSHNSRLQQTKTILDAFKTDAFLHEKGMEFYRPMQTVSYVIDAHIAKAEPWIYHLHNTVLHSIISVLIFYLLLLLGSKPSLSFLSTTVFASAPLFTHAISWVPSRGDILVCLFLVLALIFLIKYIKLNKIQFIVMHFIAFAFAVFSKETAAVAPAVFLFYLVVIGRKKIFSKQTILFTVIYSALDAIYLLFRSNAVKSVVSSEVLNFYTFFENIQTAPEFIAKFFIPLNIGVMPNFTLSSTLIGCVLIAGIIYFAIINKNNRNLIIFGLIWYFMFVIPGMLYRHWCADISYDYFEHRSYLPLFGILLIFSMGLKEINKKVKTQTLAMMILPVALVFAYITFGQSKNYFDAMSFYGSAIEYNQKNVIAHQGRGKIRLDNKDYQGCVDDNTMCLLADSTYAAAYYNRGTAYMNLQRYDLALNDFLNAVNYKNDYSDAYNNLGITQFTLGDNQQAIKSFQLSLHYNPNVVDVYYNYGTVLLKEGAYQKSIELFSTAISRRPNYFEAYFNRGIVYRNMKDPVRSIKDFSMVLQINPNYTPAYYQRGLSKQMSGDISGACQDWTIARDRGMTDSQIMLRDYCN